jgi:hypothetical protein
MEQEKEKIVLENSVIKPNLIMSFNETDYRLLSTIDEESLDNTIEGIEAFLSTKEGKGKSEAEKDELYTSAKEIWGDLASLLKSTKYTFYLNRKQYHFLKDLLEEKLEYDVNTVFVAIELANMLGHWKDSGAKLANDKDIKGYTADATEITYIYHLISKHKVKGLGASTFLFTEILRKIGDLSKIISYYDNKAKSLSKEIQDWVAAFEEGVNSESVEALKEKTKAKKIKKEIEISE